MKGFSNNSSSICLILSKRQQTHVSFDLIIFDPSIAIRAELSGKFEIVLILDVVAEILLVSRVDQRIDKVHTNNKLFEQSFIHVNHSIAGTRS